MIIKNKVYDVTDFLPVCTFILILTLRHWIYYATLKEHPGGAKIILKYAGKDATAAYEPIHPTDALEKHLPPEKHLGSIDSKAAKEIRQANKEKKKTQDELRMEKAQKEKPPLSRILNVKEMEVS